MQTQNVTIMFALPTVDNISSQKNRLHYFPIRDYLLFASARIKRFPLAPAILQNKTLNMFCTTTKVNHKDGSKHNNAAENLEKPRQRQVSAELMRTTDLAGELS